MRYKSDLYIIDLEMNQPSGTIIQVGGVCWKRDNGIDHSTKFLSNVKTKEKINPYITDLTGIQQKDVRNAPKLKDVIKQLEKAVFKETTNVVLAGWGADVAYLLNKCNEQGIEWPFKRKSFDIKSKVVFLANLMDVKYKTDGLASLSKAFGLEKNMEAHNALADSMQTARLFQEAIKQYKTQGERARKALKKLGF